MSPGVGPSSGFPVIWLVFYPASVLAPVFCLSGQCHTLLLVPALVFRLSGRCLTRLLMASGAGSGFPVSWPRCHTWLPVPAPVFWLSGGCLSRRPVPALVVWLSGWCLIRLLVLGPVFRPASQRHVFVNISRPSAFYPYLAITRGTRFDQSSIHPSDSEFRLVVALDP